VRWKAPESRKDVELALTEAGRLDLLEVYRKRVARLPKANRAKQAVVHFDSME